MAAPNNTHQGQFALQLVRKDFVGRVFHDINIYDAFRIFEQLTAIRAEVLQVYFLADFMVAFGNFIERFNSRHIYDTAFCKVDNYFIRVVQDVKLFIESRYGAKEKRAVYFVVLHTIFIRSFSCSDPLCIIPSKNQSSYDDSNNNRQS